MILSSQEISRFFARLVPMYYYMIVGYDREKNNNDNKKKEEKEKPCVMHEGIIEYFSEQL